MLIFKIFIISGNFWKDWNKFPEIFRRKFSAGNFRTHTSRCWRRNKCVFIATQSFTSFQNSTGCQWKKWRATHNSVSACDEDSMRLIVVESLGRHEPHNSVHSTVVGHRQIQPPVLPQEHMQVSAAVGHETAKTELTIFIRQNGREHIKKRKIR